MTKQKTITTHTRQERRIRWQHGLTDTQARLIARLCFGEAAK